MLQDNIAMLLIAVILGFILVIALIALVLNPPEAWVKRAYRRDHKN